MFLPECSAVIRRAGILLLLCCFFSCVDSGQPGSELSVRTMVTASGSGSVQCTVYLEGSTGDSVSGALVILRDEANRATMLSYDSKTCAYGASVEEPAADTTYTIEITSMLLDYPLVQKIPYSAITKKPNITVFQDAAGNSVLNGKELSKTAPLQIAWASCGTGIVYQLSVKTALKTIYAVSSNAETVTIPADTIPAGSYTLEILAQKIYGDPYFKYADYCSMSSSKSSALSFNVN